MLVMMMGSSIHVLIFYVLLYVLPRHFRAQGLKMRTAPSTQKGKVG